MKLVYVIGYPGSGKSSAVSRALTIAGFNHGTERDLPIPHIVWQSAQGNTINEIGRRRDSFSGTDALALNIQPRAVTWLRTKPAELLVAEGDRLANPSFFNVAQEVADSFVLALIEVPLEVARERARRRAEKLSRPEQNETWWRGRATKVGNLVEGFDAYVTRIDGLGQPKAVAEAVAGLLLGA